MQPKNILYVVNNDTTTGIALEVAETIKKEHPHFNTVVYYAKSPYPQYPSEQELINIAARSFFDIKAYKKIYVLLKKVQPKIVHVHHTISAVVFFIFAKIACPSAHLIKTVHSSHKSLRWNQQLINFIIYLMADKLLCNSKSTKKSFPALYRFLFYKKTKVCYNGVDLVKIWNAPSLTKDIHLLRDNCIVIGSVGRLISVKDYKTLIKAFADLRKKSERKMKLLLIGDGNERKKLEDLARKKNIHHDIIFTGAINRYNVYSFLKEIDVFAVTSLHEGFCNALVEAMAAEKAIVCSEIETLKEIAGEAALFAEPGSPKSFSQQILNLLKDEELFKEIKKKAGKRAEIFSIESCAEQYIEHYKQM